MQKTLSIKRNIFIGLSDIAGYYALIARELKIKGHNVTYFCNNQSIYDPTIFPVANHLWIMRLILYAQSKYKLSTIIFIRLFWLFIREFTTPFLYFWASRNHDVFIFSFGHTFFPGCFDLMWLKKKGKRIISNIAHGDESRPPYMSGSTILNKKGKINSPFKIVVLCYLMKRKINLIEKYSDIVINSACKSLFQKKPFINIYEIGIPMEIEFPMPELRTNDRIRILHSPSNPIVKGTALVRKAIKELIAQGYNINYIEITNLPHQKVLEEIALCDFVVDQVYSNTPLAGFASEAAYFAKPAVVGGYFVKYLKNQIPIERFSISKVCHPDKIKEAIEELIIDKNYRVSLGKSAQSFVLTKLKPTKVSNCFIKLVEGYVPKNWYLEPQDTIYLHGAGVSEENCRFFIKKMIKKYGIASLQLKHRPDLEKAFIEFVNNNEIKKND